jgi:hypothetical protein
VVKGPSIPLLDVCAVSSDKQVKPAARFTRACVLEISEHEPQWARSYVDYDSNITLVDSMVHDVQLGTC